jgi:hypothetical protein
MDDGRYPISPDVLDARRGAAAAPIVIDVRRGADVVGAPVLAAGNGVTPFDQIEIAPLPSVRNEPVICRVHRSGGLSTQRRSS